MDLRRTNFESIWESRVERDPLILEALANGLSSNVSEAARAELLRFHGTEGVSDPVEIELREGYDRLLAAWSIFEIASHLRLVPSPLPENHAETMRAILALPSVRAFYTEHYPVPLASRLLARIEAPSRGSTCPADQAPRGAKLFARFLDLDARFYGSENLKCFEKLLDDFGWGPFDLHAFLDRCKTPEEFGAMLSGESDAPNGSVAREASRGFLEFLSFATELDVLLEHAEKVDGLREAIASHYAFWFAAVDRKVDEKLDRVLAGIEGWSSEMTAAVSIEEAMQAVVDPVDANGVRLALRRITEASVRGAAGVGGSP